MTPEQFLAQIQKQAPAGVYFFLGPETYTRKECRRALTDRVLSEEEREQGLTRHDLDEVSVDAVLDDARSLSLFAPVRLIWASAAEAAVPKDADAHAGLAAYVKDPTPGVTIVFDSSRFDFDGEDKSKQERVRKHYGPIKDVVEFARFDERRARDLAKRLAGEQGLRMRADAIEALVEALGADAARIAMEIEKLALYANGREITAAELANGLIADGRATTIFALVNALGRRDRPASLALLDTLVREGEYLPLALTFLGTQFRLALVAREQGLRSAGDIQIFFQKQGIAMWRQRAEQVSATVGAFPREKLEGAIGKVFAADRALRDTRPDDRVVMEEFVLELTR
ncbi:MAG TPA: DNA polymerase III subunit delta [Solibacterales bacterium]|nr:DNA polymerase III subunit delta [Bryobacterales bacterium]